MWIIIFIFQVYADPGKLQEIPNWIFYLMYASRLFSFHCPCLEISRLIFILNTVQYTLHGEVIAWTTEVLWFLDFRLWFFFQTLELRTEWGQFMSIEWRIRFVIIESSPTPTETWRRPECENNRNVVKASMWILVRVCHWIRIISYHQNHFWLIWLFKGLSP